MSGTDRSKKSDRVYPGHMKDGRAKPGAGPAIILVEPQLGENIGTAARAMLNCGLTDLRLVRAARRLAERARRSPRLRAPTP